MDGGDRSNRYLEVLENSEYQPISAEELALLRGAVNYCIESGEGV